MKKNIRLLLLLLGCILVVNSCQPSIGTAWYSKSGSSNKHHMYITKITVKNESVIPLGYSGKDRTGTHSAYKTEESFSEAKMYTINVLPTVNEISASDITVEVVRSLSTMEKIKPEELEIIVNGDEIPLNIGQAVPLTLIVKHNQKKYADVEKVIKITQMEPPELVLTELFIFDKKIDNFDSESVNISVPYKESVITAANIHAQFKIGDDTLKEPPIKIAGGAVNLIEEIPVDVKIMVSELKGQYKGFEKNITITREKRKADEAVALELDELEICGISGSPGEVLTVPYDTAVITNADIFAAFKNFSDIEVLMEPKSVEFGNSDTVNFTLSVLAKEGVYLAWKLNVTVKKDSDSTAGKNTPTDKYGNKKYIQKIITEVIEQDPFDYYDRQSGGYDASQFDKWILNMTSINSSDVASYIFKEKDINKPEETEWEGSDPEICKGPQISPGSMNTAWNLQYYKYKSRISRWANEDGFTPNLSADELRKENRFLFFKFTGDASMGTKLNNSMFCLDTYSKFLFFYSEPGNKKNVAGHTVPSDWRDYAAPSYGNAHTQSDIPFYMTDPVGYVLPDGKVLIYQWVKDNIAKGDYGPKQELNKPAGKKLSEFGYSPYRDKIKTKKTRIDNIKNENYTVSEPIIKMQPRSIREKLNTPKDVSFKIRVLKAPEGETITYQWYLADDFESSGEIIVGAVENIYRPDTSEKTNKYCYCIVTNTNDENGKTTEVKSAVVQLYIDETLVINAEKPRITAQPENQTIALNEEKEISLKVSAISMDKGTLSYQWYEVTFNGEKDEKKLIDGEDSAVYTFTPNSNTVGEKRYCCVIKNRNGKADGDKEAEITSAIALVTIQEAYQVNFDKIGEGSIIALVDKNFVIKSGAYIEPNRTITFIASPAAGYKIKADGWNTNGIAIEYENALKNIAAVQLKKEAITVTVEFEKIPGRVLCVTAKSIKNIDLDNYATDNKKQRDHTYFEANFQAKLKNDFVSIWSFNRDSGMVVKGSKKENNEDGKVERLFKLEETPQSFEILTDLIKYDKDFANNWTTFSYKDDISDSTKDIIKFKYFDNGSSGYWALDPDANKNLGKEKVNITLQQDFRLEYGYEKDFTVRYDIDNLSSSTNGSLELIYTISWK